MTSSTRQRETLLEVLAGYQARSSEEAHDVELVRELARTGDPWIRSQPLHATGSAVVTHPPTRRVLLRWHARMRAWLQVGGHADPGETDPFQVALREAQEETGLLDLAPWPDTARPVVVHVAVVPVPAGGGEPAHRHADVRYALATSSPEASTPESDTAQLRWLELEEALTAVGEDNLRICLQRISEMLVVA